MTTATHDLLFGDSLAMAVEAIIGRAIRANLRDEYLKAVQQLQGIRSLLIFMGGVGRDAMVHLALSNEISRMHQLADDEKTRAVVAHIVAARHA